MGIRERPGVELLYRVNSMDSDTPSNQRAYDYFKGLMEKYGVTFEKRPFVCTSTPASEIIFIRTPIQRRLAYTTYTLEEVMSSRSSLNELAIKLKVLARFQREPKKRGDLGSEV